MTEGQGQRSRRNRMDAALLPRNSDNCSSLQQKRPQILHRSRFLFLQWDDFSGLEDVILKPSLTLTCSALAALSIHLYSSCSPSLSSLL
jgi:hypothetical protein